MDERQSPLSSLAVTAVDGGDCDERLVFQLFVSPRAAGRSRIDQLVRQVLESVVAPGAYELEVVDTVENPMLAHAQKVLATPTLIRRSPGPEVRAIGDLSDHEGVLARFGLV